MGEPRISRINDTLRDLFQSLAPPTDIKDSAVDQRIDAAIEYATDIVLAGDAAQPADINQAQDLIKRKLLRENASPEKAARFSNLYSRLLAIPVLNQKWSILYLLYSLSEEQSIGGRYTRNPLAESDQLENIHNHSDSIRHPKAVDKGGDESSGKRYSSRRDLGALPARIQKQTPLEEARTERETPKISSANVNGHLEEQPVSLKVVPTEADLLRDLPFNLQGLTSSHFEFTSTSTIRLPTTLPVPIISLLHTLAEPCLLYKSLSDYTRCSDGGLVSQSLRAAISGELRSYLSLVASLEGEIRRALTAIEREGANQGVRKVGVTLKRCVIWTRDATMGLRLMSIVVEESQQKRGGQLISFIHGFSSSHGDPFVASYAERLLGHATRPFYDMLRRWIYDGELIDPYHEFFVTEPDPRTKPDIDPRRVATSVWEDKYKIDTNMVPSILSSELAKKVFLIGKSLNFIRHNCGDSDWVIHYSKSNSKPLDHANTTALFDSVDSAYRTTMSRLTYLMSTKFQLFTHLSAIKRYLLLSQGDFIALLMESLAPYLDRPPNSQYRHTLTSQLEHAIRHSNAQYDDADVLRRLDARMAELSSGDSGWDCFTLEYKISAPCDVIVTQWANTQYLRVFNTLWKIRRVDFALNSTWRRCMTGARGSLRAVEDTLGSDWKRTRCVMAEMIHFINQLQYYMLFEVIEASWEQLQAALQKPDSTLDDLIEAHTKYITGITQKGLLGQQQHASTGRREDSLIVQVGETLKCMRSYCEVVEGLYSYSVSEDIKRQQFSARVEQRTAQGKWGITEKDLVPGTGTSRAKTPVPGNLAKHNVGSESADSSAYTLSGAAGDDLTQLSSLRSRLLKLSAEFRSRINMLLYDLAHQPDVNMRFLGVVMNFNEVYTPVNVRRQQARKAREKKLDMERKQREGSVAANNTVREGVGAGQQGRDSR